MDDNKSSDASSEFNGSNGDADLQPKEKPAYRNLRRELTDEELTSPGTVRLLIQDVERLESELFRASKYISRFYKANTDVQVLKEKVKSLTSSSIMNNAGLTVGGVLIGIGSRMWDRVSIANNLGATIIVVLGLILIGCVIFSQFRKK